MKKSEIKDLYNQSDEALKLLDASVSLLPYVKDGEATAKATCEAKGIAARLDTIVKTMCDYMIDDGSFDMTERLQVIKSKAKQIEHDVAKMGYSKERYELALNCRSIINNIKDVEEWTANGVEPQHEAPEGTNGESGETQGNENKKPSEAKETPRKSPSWDELTDDEKWLFYCESFYNKFIDECAKNKPDTQGVVKLYKEIIDIREDNEVINLNNRLTNKWGAKKLLHELLHKWGIVKVRYEQLDRVINALL